MLPPAWEPAVGLRLLEAQRATPLLGRVAPTNLAAEIRALEDDFGRGGERQPRFTYDPAPPSGLESELHALAERLDRLGDPLATLYAAKAREIALEQRLCSTAGRAEFWRLARERYSVTASRTTAADALAREWLSLLTEPTRGSSRHDEEVSSDDERDPRSLVSRMREDIGRRRLPFRVTVQDRMSALAATGSGLVAIAAGRRLRVRDVERTVVHEIEGHALPLVEAERRALALFRLGTARGSDHQEGRALCIEQREGWLDDRRRRELALRHVACRAVEARADFVATVRLLRDFEAPLVDALRIAARAHRGGGLGREAVYLASLLQVTEAVALDPSLDEVLATGRIAVEAASIVRPWMSVRDTSAPG